jgi:plasmid stabilization system protein ParE
VRLRVEDEAERDAVEAAVWYDGESPGTGHDFLVRLAEAYAAIEENPDRFPLEESVRTKRPLRYCMLTKFPFRVIFETVAEEIRVFAVAHGARRPGYWRRRLR